jgi:hypothetical protein
MKLWLKIICGRSNRRIGARARCRLSLERLEDRLAPTVTITPGTLNDVTFAHTTPPPVDQPFSVTNPTNAPLSYSATVVPGAAVVQQRYALILGSSFFQNALGQNEKWLLSSLPPTDPNSNSANGNWYLIFPDGSLHAWTGGSTFGPTLAQLDRSFWANPTNQFELAALGDPAVAGTAANLAQTHDLGFAGSYYYNALGAGEEWLQSNLLPSDPKSNSAHGGWYLLFPDGTIRPWDGTANSSQALAPIVKVNPLFWQTYPDALVTSPDAALAYTTEQTLALTFSISYGQNTYNDNEKWVRSANGSNPAFGNWYVIFPDGTLRAWNGSTTASGVASAPVLTTLTSSYWFNPNLLLMARPPLTPPPSVTATPIAATNTGAVIRLTGYSSFVGSAGVEVTVSDGIQPATGYFLATSTDAALSFTLNTSGQPAAFTYNPPAIATVSTVHTATSVSGINFTTTDSDFPAATAPPLTYSTQVVTAAYAVAQEFGLDFAGSYFYNSLKAGEEWMHSSLPASNPLSNSANGGWYLLFSNGSIRQYNGTASGPIVATVDPAFWQMNPDQLVTAPYAQTAFNTKQMLDLVSVNSSLQNSLGLNEKWLHSGLAVSNPLSNVANGGWYLLLPNGELHAYDGSFSALSGTLEATLSASYWNNPKLLFGAKNPTPGIAATNGATQSGNFVTITTTSPHPFSVGQIVTISGVGVAGYDGTFQILSVPSATTFIVANLNAGLSPSGGGMVSATPSGVNPVTSGAGAGGVSVNVSGTTAYVGTFGISTTASDGVLTRAQDFLFTTTDTTPLTFASPGTQVASQGGTPQLQVNLAAPPANAGDPDSPPATLTSRLYVFSDSKSAAAFSLSQSLLLAQDPFASPGNPYDMGSFGTNYKWVYGYSGNNAAGNRYYFLTSSGELHYWDGTNTPDVSAVTLVGTFDASYYANPMKLLNPVTTPSGNTGATVNSFGLIVQVVSGLSQAQSPYFGVAVITDGVLTARQTFQINVGP